jgi:hypothetical protein
MDHLSISPSINRSPWILSILSNMSWPFRLQLIPTLSKDWNSLSKQNLLKEFYCERLSLENGVYHSKVPPPGISYSTMFKELFSLRSMWVPSQQHLLYRAAFEKKAQRVRFEELTGESNQDDLDTSSKQDTISPTPPPSRYSVGVCVRFRPKKETKGASKFNEQEQEEARIIAAKKSRFLLPLHQRLQLIKIRENCNTKSAIETLQNEGAWFDRSWKKKPVASASEDKENDSSYGSGSQEARVQSIDSGMGTIIMVTPAIGVRPFKFDHVIGGRTNQSTTYDLTTKRLVMDMCNGFNSSVIMFGQTGSGKTWTCFGPSERDRTIKDEESGGSKMRKFDRNRGLVQRACEEVFIAAEQRLALGIECQLHVSYVEIYGNEVTDLLRNGERVGHNKVSSQRYVMSGQAKQSVNSLNDIRRALEIGDAQKRRAATAMNDRSSRAHSLFVISMSMFNHSTGVRISSELYLADLGGSEQVKRSLVHHGGYDKETGTALGFQMGGNMKEAVNINLGLLALKRCIGALNDGHDYVR